MAPARLLFAALLLAPVLLLAQNPAPPARLSDVAWLEGYWEGEGFGGKADESWMPARSGAMIGVFRSLKPDGSPSLYEILAIEEVEDSLRLVVKHFRPDWVGWEEKDQALKLRLTRISATEAAFGGVVLKRDGHSGLNVEVTMRRKDGSSSTSVLTFKRKPAP
jgi:hypothetical protein